MPKKNTPPKYLQFGNAITVNAKSKHFYRVYPKLVHIEKYLNKNIPSRVIEVREIEREGLANKLVLKRVELACKGLLLLMRPVIVICQTRSLLLPWDHSESVDLANTNSWWELGPNRTASSHPIITHLPSRSLQWRTSRRSCNLARYGKVYY